jgi:battenin
MRLLGIGVASFSSGLGELTFLQFSTTLPTRRLGKTALGAWSSGTGGAGIAGAGLWWLLRGLGVTKGLGLSSVLPLCFPLAFHVVLPPFSRLPRGNDLANYEPIFVADDDASEISIPLEVPTKVDQKALSSRQKIELVKPLLLRYMLWLFLVYVFEYVINSVGIDFVRPSPDRPTYCADPHAGCGADAGV